MTQVSNTFIPSRANYLAKILFPAECRGLSESCYHRPCDSVENFVNKENLHFLKNTIDVMKSVICNMSSVYQQASMAGNDCSRGHLCVESACVTILATKILLCLLLPLGV